MQQRPQQTQGQSLVERSLLAAAAVASVILLLIEAHKYSASAEGKWLSGLHLPRGGPAMELVLIVVLLAVPWLAIVYMLRARKKKNDLAVRETARTAQSDMQSVGGALPYLEDNELRYPHLPKGPQTMLWRWSYGEVVGPFCPIHKDALLYRFVAETKPFDDESWLGSGGFFYCPADNQEVFRYGLDNMGAKVKNLKMEVREQFKKKLAHNVSS